MTDMFRSEIKITLSEHRLIEPSGWMDDNGRVEYECRCGHKMHETPRSSIYQGGETMLAEHQAEVLDQLGFRRAPDDFDTFALDQLCSTLVQRRAELSVLIQAHSWSMNAHDRNRLIGAHGELEALESTLKTFICARVRSDGWELPLATLAIA